jgi:hypothetical protein
MAGKPAKQPLNCLILTFPNLYQYEPWHEEAENRYTAYYTSKLDPHVAKFHSYVLWWFINLGISVGFSFFSVQQSVNDRSDLVIYVNARNNLVATALCKNLALWVTAWSSSFDDMSIYELSFCTQEEFNTIVVETFFCVRSIHRLKLIDFSIADSCDPVAKRLILHLSRTISSRNWCGMMNAPPANFVSCTEFKVAFPVKPHKQELYLVNNEGNWDKIVGYSTAILNMVNCIFGELGDCDFHCLYCKVQNEVIFYFKINECEISFDPAILKDWFNNPKLQRLYPFVFNKGTFTILAESYYVSELNRLRATSYEECTFEAVDSHFEAGKQPIIERNHALQRATAYEKLFLWVWRLNEQKLRASNPLPAYASDDDNDYASDSD